MHMCVYGWVSPCVCVCLELSVGVVVCVCMFCLVCVCSMCVLTCNLPEQERSICVYGGKVAGSRGPVP